MILIVGSPRSGTTWLAKLFDSHPGVLYRHEPDAILPPPSFPQFPDPENVPDFLGEARDFVQSMSTAHAARVAGSPPLFRKTYLSRAAASLRASILLGTKAGSRLLGNPAWAERLPVPDFADPDRDRTITVVIKSVISNGRAYLYSRAVPDLKVIHLIRHPGGQFASLKRGRNGHLRTGGGFPGKTLAQSRLGRKYELTAERFDAMTHLERATWQWIIVNETLIRDFAGNPNYRIVQYEDLCADPITHIKQLFDFAGLDWNEQSSEFVERSLTFEGDAKGYFDVVRNPSVAASKWRDELSADEIGTMTRIAAATPLGKLCFGTDGGGTDPVSHDPGRP